ncbi:MAG TPA: hypothetical protein VNG94_04370, partial [Pyrinomonadaceae bacterium]|nr:hypothetical protein [Pyrinomonadaceae bacterium]
WENSAVMLDTTNGNARNLVFHQAVVSDEAVAGALERLYQDHHYRRQMSIAAYAKATSAEYQWKSIAQQWARVFDDLNQENTGPAAAQ